MTLAPPEKVVWRGSWPGVPARIQEGCGYNPRKMESGQMERFAFISRHAPTPDQIRVAGEQGIEVIHVGDTDAFGPGDPILPPGVRWGDTPKTDYQGIIAVHPLIAVRSYALGKKIGSFQNISRPGVDGKPQFTCGRLVVIDPSKALKICALG